MIVDGRQAPVVPGVSILDAARGAGVAIPVLCHHPALPPDGSCRMCLVEIDGRPGLHPACVVPAESALGWLVPEATVEVHPRDAARLGVADDARVRLHSRRGTVTARARLTPGISEGTVFMPFHFVEAAANELTHAAVDPVAKIPEYKVCAVALEADDRA